MNETTTADAANPYAAPEHLGSLEAVGQSSRFYVVAPRKFLVLFVGTAGLYSLYWMYRQWAQFRRDTRGSEWPVARAIFSVFFFHSLFEEIELLRRRQAARFDWNPRSLANWLVGLVIVTNVCDRMAGYGIGSPATDVISVLSIFLLASMYLPAQRAANAACGDPEGAGNARITVANILWLFVGLVFWTLVILGTLMAFGLMAD